MMVSVYLPWWRAERLARRLRPRPDAVLLARAERGQRIVAAMCGAAFKAGVRRGLSIAHARAQLAGTVHIADEDAPADARTLAAMAQWASRRWSPIVSVDGTDGLLLNVAGCEHLFAGLDGLVRDMERAVRALRVTPFIGAARTLGAAWAVARFAPREVRLVPSGREREAISPLPVAALRIDDEIVGALAEVGIERIGQLLELPRSSLPARYGDDLLLRVDQALGHAIELVDRTRERNDLLASHEIPGGTTRLESIEAVTKRLLTHLVDSLLRMESGLRCLHATLIAWAARRSSAKSKSRAPAATRAISGRSFIPRSSAFTWASASNASRCGRRESRGWRTRRRRSPARAKARAAQTATMKALTMRGRWAS